MFTVHGLTHDEVTAELEEFEQLFHSAVLNVMRKVASQLGETIISAGEPGEPNVSMDTLNLIATLWVSEVFGIGGDAEEIKNDSLVAALGRVYRKSVNRIWEALKKAFQRARKKTPENLFPLEDAEGDSDIFLDQEDDPENLLFPDEIAEDYLSLAGNRMVRFSDELWELTREQLLQGFAEGESIDELRDRLILVVGLSEGRATVVARTEIHQATEAGSLAMVQYSEFTGTKTWLATEDPRTRPTHAEADGQTVGLEEFFEVGGFPLLFPGDPAGPPQETIQCRCTQTYNLDDEPLVASGHLEFCRAPLHKGPCAKPGSKAYIRRHGKSATLEAPKEKVKTDNSGKVAKKPRSINTEEEAASWGKKNFTATEDLSEGEQNSLQYYAGNTDGYRKINGALRGTESNPDVVRSVQQDIKNLDSVMSRNQTPEDLIVSRAMDASVFGGDPSSFVGKVMQDKGYLSTSLGDVPGGVLSSKDVHLRISVPKGTPAYSMQDISRYKEERELLLGRETNLAITEATYDEKEERWYLKAEVVL